MSIRSTYPACAVIAATALAMALASPTVASGYAGPGDEGPTLRVSSELRDLRPTIADPTDGARSELRVTVDEDSAKFRLTLRGLDRAAAGRTFGAHLHLGTCVAGDGAAALAHYNTDVINGVTPVRANPDTEVWLDFTATDEGTAMVGAVVPFAPAAGNHSIVIHRDPTAGTGVAGPRLACLPVAW